MSVNMLVSGAALWFLIAGTRSSILATSGSINDIAQWGISSRLWVDARVANAVTLYGNFTAASIESWLRRVVNDRGNVMVLSLSESVGNKTRYTKLTGYIYRPNTSPGATDGTIARFAFTVSSADQAAYTPLEDILKNNLTAISNSATIVASGVTPINSGGAFLCRSAGTAATLGCSIASGSASNRTQQRKLIEATFYIRG